MEWEQGSSLEGMYVLTVDQRGSTGRPDRVPEVLARLEEVLADRAGVVVPFDRTVGDEVQGVLDHPEVVVEVVLDLLRDGGDGRVARGRPAVVGAVVDMREPLPGTVAVGVDRPGKEGVAGRPGDGVGPNSPAGGRRPDHPDRPDRTPAGQRERGRSEGSQPGRGARAATDASRERYTTYGRNT